MQKWTAHQKKEVVILDKLSHCPYCGCEDIHSEISYEHKEFRLYCDRCPAEMTLMFVDAGLGRGEIIGFSEMEIIMRELIGNWNKRTPKGGEEK